MDPKTLPTHSVARSQGEVSVSGGEGDDIISFGDDIGFRGGALNVSGGTGSDEISIGADASNVTVDMGFGTDTLIFDTGADILNIDFGADSDADSLVFLGTLEDVTVANWVQGVDTVDVLDPSLWSISSDDGTDTVLSNGTSTLKFLGVSGLIDSDEFLF